MSNLSRVAIGGTLVVVVAGVALLLARGRSETPAPRAAAPAELRARASNDPRWSPGQAPPAQAEKPVRATVAGRLVDHETGRGVAGVQVYFTDARSGTTTDAAGAFSLPDVPTGRKVRLRVDKSGEYLADVIDVMVPPGVSSVDAGSTHLVRGNWTGKFEGGPAGLVGINHELRDGKMYVTEVRDGTPAAQAGILVGDRVVSVDGKPVDGLGHRARSFLVMGKAGTTVTFVLEAPTGGTRSVTLTRIAGQGRPSYPFADRKM
jgi:hypothetical protein